MSVKIDEAAVPTLEDNNELIRRYTRAVFDEGEVADVDRENDPGVNIRLLTRASTPEKARSGASRSEPSQH